MVVELRGVSKVYVRRGGGRVQALRGASLHVGAGELVVLAGPSGAGKSTLLRLLTGEERPTEGRVRMDGEDIGTLRRGRLARLRRQMGVVPQEPRLVADRSALGNVTLVLRALGMAAAEARARSLEALRDAGLAACATAFPGELAAGERRRLVLARAVAPAPRLLLADEPTAMLDEVATREVAELLRAVQAGGTTVVVATRDPALAAALKARVLSVEGGRVSEGPHGAA